MSTPEGRIETINIDDEMRQSYIMYSMSVITARALPDVRDGLKPVQRRLLQAMWDLNLTGATTRKCAKICGDTSGNYHPHGESVIYPALVRMGQEWSLRYPLVAKQGNFGSIDGDPPAAMRYTEARLSSIAIEMLADINEDTVDWTDNFDSTRQEPSVLPSRIPNLIVNGGTGIAVGMATNMAPHNLGETCDAIALYLDNPRLTLDELMAVLPAPDFPTAGLILGTKGVREAYETGRGAITMQAKIHIEPQDNGRNSIVITEVPYQVQKTRLIEQIAELVKQKKVTGISDIFDYSSKGEIRVVIEVRRDTDPQRLLNYLLKHTQLRVNFHILALALVDGKPQVLPMVEQIKHYVAHRRVVIRRRTRFRLNKAEQRLHILEGLIRALDIIDEIIILIRASETPAAARRGLMAEFEFSQTQAQHILEMQLQRLTSLERERLEKERDELVTTITDLKEILANPKRVIQIIKDDLAEIKKKHGNPRRTRIIKAEAHEIGEEDMIPEEEMIITITRNGYIKRVPADTYRPQHRGGRGVIGVTAREEDETEHLFMATTHHHVLFFTDVGKVYRLKAYEVPLTSRQAMGTAIVNLIGIQPGERVTATIPLESLEAEGYLIMGTRLGEVKRTALLRFKNLRSNGLRAFDLEEGDSLNWVRRTDGETEIMLVTRQGKSIRFSEAEMRIASRASGGVRGIRLVGDDEVIGMGAVAAGEDVLVVGANGYGKRTLVGEYPKQHRGGSGVLTMRVTQKTGAIGDFKMVADGDRLLISTTNGIVIRVRVEEIRRIGRSTEGVRLIRLEAGDHVASIARVRPQEPDPERDARNEERRKQLQLLLGSDEPIQQRARRRRRPQPKPDSNGE